VARDRKRAKQRRDRRATRAPARKPDAPAAGAHGPSELEHASSNIDEFDAALVRGAGGVEPEPDAAEGPAVALDDELPVAEESRGDVDEPAADRLEDEPLAGEGGGDDGDGRTPTARGGEGARERPSGAPLPSGNRAVAFIRASWAELQRVQWPDRRQVTQATAVVLGFVAVAGAYLGLADLVAKEIVEFVL
jgi:preprotein translocase subunit SecE